LIEWPKDIQLREDYADEAYHPGCHNRMNYFDDLISHRGGQQLFHFRPHGHAYRCVCGQPIYFRNTQCLNCQRALGYDSAQGLLLTLTSDDNGRSWTDASATPASNTRYRRCEHVRSPAACNWLIPVESGSNTCIACSLNRTIPNLSSEQNQRYWQRIEAAKRRLVAQLLLMGLPVVPKSVDPQKGIAFDFLEQLPGEKPVLIGHDNGLITLNIAEADDTNREALREQLREAYRTLLGHLRHESGHYYWDLLVRDNHWIEPVRRLFGDDRTDYSAALANHYQSGPPANWQQLFISGYATAHPWEDWAETWAHYLHMTDALNTALDFGINTSEVEPQAQPFRQDALFDPDAEDASAFLDFINHWIALTAVTNELARSMGQRDLYPFTIAPAVVAKLQLVHLIVKDAASRQTN